MRYWISKKSEVPVREQLTAQILLAITSKSLQPGEQLPSTRSLARRLEIHSNTINAAYRDLARRGWVDIRKGSGVYIRAVDGESPMDGELELDRLIVRFLGKAQDDGFSLGELRSRLRHWLELQPPDHFLIIEEDPELRRILRHEIGSFTGFRVDGVGIDGCRDPEILSGALPVALYAKADRIRKALPDDRECLWLQTHSVHDELQKSLRPASEDAFVVVVSGWPDFLRWAKTLLVAAGLSPDILSFQDAKTPGWEKSLRLATFVITDSLTLEKLPARWRPRSFVFPIVSKASLLELQRYARELTDS